MGFRSRRSVRIATAFRLDLSSQRLSATAGLLGFAIGFALTGLLRA